jgi:hypothetical protein
MLVCVVSRARMSAETIQRSLGLCIELHGALPPHVDLVLNGFEPGEAWAVELAQLAAGDLASFGRVLTIPFDPCVAEQERANRSLLDLDAATPAVRALAAWEAT